MTSSRKIAHIPVCSGVYFSRERPSIFKRLGFAIL